jgi:hypothetical protein
MVLQEFDFLLIILDRLNDFKLTSLLNLCWFRYFFITLWLILRQIFLDLNNYYLLFFMFLLLWLFFIILLG